jgi:hypothetical protein
LAEASNAAPSAVPKDLVAEPHYALAALARFIPLPRPDVPMAALRPARPVLRYHFTCALPVRADARIEQQATARDPSPVLRPFAPGLLAGQNSNFRRHHRLELAPRTDHPPNRSALFFHS